MKTRKGPLSAKPKDSVADAIRKAEDVKERENNLKRKFAFLNDKEKANGLGCKTCGEVGHLSFQCMNGITITRPKPSDNSKGDIKELAKKIEALKSMNKKIKKAR